MTIDDQIKNEILLSILIKKLQKYQSYYQAKLISMKLLQLKKLTSKQKLILEQAKFTDSPLVKAFEKQTSTIEDQGKTKSKQLKSMKKKLNLMKFSKMILI